MISLPQLQPEISLADAVRRTAAGEGPIARLRALVLLSGSLRSGELQAATQRALLDLPVTAEESLVDLWQAQAEALAQSACIERLSVRILVDRDAAMPGPHAKGVAVDVVSERDAAALRGTGGVLRDLANLYGDDDYILVASAAQLLTEPLSALAASVAYTCRDVSLISHEDGTPSSLMLIRCGCLKLIPEIGFVDMKEQALPLIAAHHDVNVICRRRPVGFAIRNRGNYISALRWYHQRKRLASAMENPFAEDWSPAFGVVEEGVVVDPSASLHDSVVLSGGRIEAGAVLVRCLVCPGAVVRRSAVVVDHVVAPSRRR